MRNGEVEIMKVGNLSERQEDLGSIPLKSYAFIRRPKTIP